MISLAGLNPGRVDPYISFNVSVQVQVIKTETLGLKSMTSVCVNKTLPYLRLLENLSYVMVVLFLALPHSLATSVLLSILNFPSLRSTQLTNFSQFGFSDSSSSNRNLNKRTALAGSSGRLSDSSMKN